MTDTDRTTLVLAPLTPKGSRGYLERVGQACAATDSLAAISYTQAPASWATNWIDTVGPLPDRSVFFYGGMQTGDEEAPFDEVVAVDPTDPMSIITGVEQRLNDWQDDEGRPVVSIQTISVLLEYVDFDTAFRYLYLLVQKINGSNAVGYFQIDPHLHEAEELNTLRSLFDAVIEFDDGEWTEAPPHNVSTEAVEESASTPTFDPVARLAALLNGWRTRLGALVSGTGSSSSTSDGETETGTADEEPSGAESTSEVTLTEEELLTDEERIKRFLQLSGGRARQADMTDEFSWSASTVSRKLSKLEAADEISRVKIGRENVVFLESSEPEALQSPLESESESSSATETSQ